MKIKSLFLAGVLATLTLSVASAKTYEVSFRNPTKAGTVQLKPGEYILSVDGGKATFVDSKTRKSFTTDVTVKTNEKKFDSTRVDASTEGETTVVKDIELGGSKTKIDF